MKDEGASPAADVLLRVKGTVQGVGFRPFVRRTALRLGLRGWVLNDEQGVLIRAAGARGSVNALREAIRASAPPAARVDSVDDAPAGPQCAAIPAGFEIAASEATGLPVQAAVPPDLALCADCRRELFEPSDRRHRYPFINCTQCGPRYSILEMLPYDRPRTTMRGFTMCPQCRREYEDPSDRRYHAQPNACGACGPAAFLTLPSGAEVRGEEALSQAVAVLASGGILAVKGIGGYHLMADAGNPAAIAGLRGRKHREEKPFAVMFPDLAAARACVETTAEAEALLASAAAPIVLLARRPDSGLAPEVAPGNPWIGVLLPYAPLQVLLLGAFGRPVVATSANLSEEPLCFTNPDAHRRLAGIADAFLDHDRRIAHPVDDSVVRLSSGAPVLLRRARGYAPSPLPLPGSLEGAWLCTGAQMKSTIGVASGERVVLSPHIGDLDGALTREVYRRTVDMLAQIQQAEFTGVVCDRHPDYASTRYAQETGLPCIAVQHHLAHVLACLLENGRGADGVLGVSWDGTGYGEDGTIWGGEFILLRGGTAVRFGRLRPFRLPGAESAIHDGRRTALALAHEADGAGFDELARLLGLESAAANLHRMLENGINSPVTTSAGRLFDAAGALIGLSGLNRFEGQTPLAVEAAAAASTIRVDFPAEVRSLAPGLGALVELDWEPVYRGLLGGRRRGVAVADLAAGFHRALAGGIAGVAARAGAGTVALTGGCFQNVRLLDLTRDALRTAGFDVIVHHELPPNDGNIAAGQALAALWNLTSVGAP